MRDKIMRRERDRVAMKERREENMERLENVENERGKKKGMEE